MLAEKEASRVEYSLSTGRTLSCLVSMRVETNCGDTVLPVVLPRVVS